MRLSFLASLLIAVPLIYFADRPPRHNHAHRLRPDTAGAIYHLHLRALVAMGDSGVVLFFSGFIVLEAAIPARVSHAALANRRGLSLG